MTKPYKRAISWSQLNSFARCRRQWYLNYVQGYKMRGEHTVASRRVGSLYHQGIGNYYDSVGIKDPFVELVAQLPGADTNLTEHIMKSLNMGVTMVENYKAWVAEAEEDKYLHIDSVEKKLFVEDGSKVFNIDEDISLIGYADLTGHDTRTGLPLIMEHKTTTDTYTTWLANTFFTLKWQARFYALLLNEGSTDPIDLVFNIARRVMGTGRAQKPFFWRHRVLFGEKDMEFARQVFSNRINELQEYEIFLTEQTKLIRSFPNPGQHCSYCDFKPVCSTFDEGRGEPVKLLESVYSTRKERYGN